jgi:hypothetical protein
VYKELLGVMLINQCKIESLSARPIASSKRIIVLNMPAMYFVISPPLLMEVKQYS